MRRFCKELAVGCYITLLLLVFASSCVTTRIDRELSSIPVDQAILSYQLDEVEEHLDEIILILIREGKVSEEEVKILIEKYKNGELE